MCLYLTVICVSIIVLATSSIYRYKYLKSLDPFGGVACLNCAQELPYMSLLYLIPDDHGVIEVVCSYCNTHNYHKDTKYSLTHPVTGESSKVPLVCFICSYIDEKEFCLRIIMLLSFLIMLASGMLLIRELRG